jgi:hypothetical protein
MDFVSKNETLQEVFENYLITFALGGVPAAEDGGLSEIYVLRDFQLS